ncbi:MAG: hypothetical protein AAGM22_11715 [Acidobacteriota bacterium]
MAGGGRSVRELRVALPESFRRGDLIRYWGRDARSAQEKTSADGIEWALRSPSGDSVRVEVAFRADVARATIDAGPTGSAPDAATVSWAEAVVPRMLGLHLDPGAFEGALLGGVHRRLIKDKLGLSIPQTATVFDGALWVICGQQVSLPVAFSLRRRLAERFGVRLGELYAPPRPADLVDIDPDVLFGLGLSRRKTEYLQGFCRLIVDGFDPEALRGAPADDVEQRLLAIRGFGPWSVNYLLMRALGDADRVPVGDAGLARALVRYFDLDRRPDASETRRLMATFAPHRSLATFHMWASFAG